MPRNKARNNNIPLTTSEMKMMDAYVKNFDVKEAAAKCNTTVKHVISNIRKPYMRKYIEQAAGFSRESILSKNQILELLSKIATGELTEKVQVKVKDYDEVGRVIGEHYEEVEREYIGSNKIKVLEMLGNYHKLWDGMMTTTYNQMQVVIQDNVPKQIEDVKYKKLYIDE